MAECTTADCLAALEKQGSEPKTLEEVRRVINLPLNTEDEEFLVGAAGNGIYPFNWLQNQPSTAGITSATPGLITPGFVVKQNMWLTGICVRFVTDCASDALDGNQIGSQSLLNTNGVPRSSAVTRRDPATGIPYNAPWGAKVATQADFLNSAQLAIGSPAWMCADAMLKAMSILVMCPGSRSTQIIHHPLADVGSCCLGTDIAGFGQSGTEWNYYVRKVNDQLAANNLKLAGMAGQDAGYFVPLNCEEGPMGPNVVSPETLTPNRLSVNGAPRAFGKIATQGGGANWLEFAAGIPLLAGQALDIRLTANDGTADNFYLTQAIDLLRMQFAQSPIPGASKNTSILAMENGYTSSVDQAITRVPGGSLGIIVTLMGASLGGEICRSMVEAYSNTSYPDWTQLVAQQGLSCGHCRVRKTNP